MNDERIISLEIKISHQELAIEGLEQNLYEQHTRLEKLEKSFKHFKERVEAMASGGGGAAPTSSGSEKPPHY